jgi:hypothetical protein
MSGRMLADRVNWQIARAERHLEEHGVGDKGRAFALDVAVVAGVALTMLGVKALKLLPSIPFAPGHKFVVLTPLYFVAAIKTKSRWGATLTGITMGTVAFLLGDGKYGLFEIAKHVTPGLVCDLLLPIYASRARPAGPIVLGLVGGLMGSMRFSTMFLAVLWTSPPKVAWAMLIPGLVANTVFGLLSGVVSAPLVRAFLPEKAAPSVQDASNGGPPQVLKGEVK